MKQKKKKISPDVFLLMVLSTLQEVCLFVSIHLFDVVGMFLCSCTVTPCIFCSTFVNSGW